MRQREQVLVLQQEEVRRSDQCQCDPQEQAVSGPGRTGSVAPWAEASPVVGPVDSGVQKTRGKFRSSTTTTTHTTTTGVFSSHNNAVHDSFLPASDGARVCHWARASLTPRHVGSGVCA